MQCRRAVPDGWPSPARSAALHTSCSAWTECFGPVAMLHREWAGMQQGNAADVTLIAPCCKALRSAVLTA